MTTDPTTDPGTAAADPIAELRRRTERIRTELGGLDAVARLRYRVLGRTGDACPVVPASERARFLD